MRRSLRLMPAPVADWRARVAPRVADEIAVTAAFVLLLLALALPIGPRAQDARAHRSSSPAFDAGTGAGTPACRADAPGDGQGGTDAPCLDLRSYL